MSSVESGSELLEPRAEDLIESLRAFGYTLPTALADLVDNSIAAKARIVKIEYCSDPGSAWLAVVDDGEGMDQEQLRNAMRFARNPNDVRPTGDLGRFGLGLKTASLSQVRKLTVLSQRDGSEPRSMTWDLDHVSRHRQWLVINRIDTEARMIIDRLGFTGKGTTVLWRVTDKLGDGPELRRRVTEAGKELSLLFHRFLTSGRLDLYVGQRKLTPMDPYLRTNPLTQDLGVEELCHDGHRIRVNPIVLPHPSRLTRREKALATGPGGMLARQGFYVYRGDRLVVAGSWLGIPGLNNSAPTRLARVAVQIPPDADLAWEVDVRKSTVRLPAPLESRIVELAVETRARSERVFTHRGTPAAAPKERQDLQTVWQQVRRHGRYEYTVNRSHPLIVDLLSKAEGPSAAGVIRMIEATLPVDLIARELHEGDSPHGKAVNEAASIEEVLATFRSILTGLPQDPEKRTALAETLATAEPFNRYPGLIREVIESDLSERF